MHLSTVFTVIFSSVVSAQQYLPTASFAINAPQASAYAFLPFAGPASNITGRFDFQSQSNGSTEVTFSLSAFPSNASYPISYFIASNGVPVDGDCYLTGPVFDPAGSLTYCNRAYPQACKVGDLSGKSFDISVNSTGNDFCDNFVSFSVDSDSYFVNKSIVLSDATGARIACTNITSVSSGTGQATSNLTQPSSVTYSQVYNVQDTAVLNGSSSTNASSATTSSTITSGASSMLQLSGIDILLKSVSAYITYLVSIEACQYTAFFLSFDSLV